eukprot:scaffold1847_cov59-Phaeocystis_antarctica.AAC.1
MRGKLIPHRTGKLLCPAFQLDDVGRHDWKAFLPSKEEAGHALAWLQAGRTQREQLIGRRADTPLQQQLQPTEVGLVPLRLAEVDPLQVRSTEVGLLQLCRTELRSIEDGLLQLCLTKVGSLQLRVTEVGLLQLCPAEVGPLQPSTHQIGKLCAIMKDPLRQVLDPLVPEMRGKLIPHRTGKLMCPALQLDDVGRHNWKAFLPSKEEPGHALAWLQAGRTQREQLIGRRADTPLQQQLQPTEVGLVPLRLTEVEPLQVRSTEVGFLQLSFKEEGLLQLCLTK